MTEEFENTQKNGHFTMRRNIVFFYLLDEIRIGTVVASLLGYFINIGGKEYFSLPFIFFIIINPFLPTIVFYFLCVFPIHKNQFLISRSISCLN